MKNALIIVAHPDDETLWVGGIMMMYPDWNWRVVSLCRGNDMERRHKFFVALKHLNSHGDMGDLDDGPDQTPLARQIVEEAVSRAVNNVSYDLIVTHSPFGEYTRHIRHEEIGLAVVSLWQTEAITTKELWMFAYTDNEKKHYPRAIKDAHWEVMLPDEIWKKKVNIIQNVYGFAPSSWETMTTPKREALWKFNNSEKALTWQKRYEY